MKNALIVGASGLIGKHLVHQLLNQSIYKEIHLLNRKSLNYSDERIKEHIIDFNNMNDLELNVEFKDVFCCLGTTMKIAGSKEKFKLVDYTYVLNTANFGLKHQAEKFCMVSSIGADDASNFSFYLKTKGDTETAVSLLGYESTFIFRPSLLVGPREVSRTGEKFGELVLKLFTPLLIGRLRKQRPVHVSQVANAMIDSCKGEVFDRHKIIESTEIIKFSKFEI